MAFEIFVRTMHILDNEYEVFMKALYTEEELDVREPSLPSELRELLEGLRGDLDLPSGLRSLLDGLEESETDEASEDNEETVSAGREDGTGGNGAARGIDTDSVDGQESFAAFLRMRILPTTLLGKCSPRLRSIITSCSERSQLRNLSNSSGSPLKMSGKLSSAIIAGRGVFSPLSLFNEEKTRILSFSTKERLI